jgi:hypothetical protein
MVERETITLFVMYFDLLFGRAATRNIVMLIWL